MAIYNSLVNSPDSRTFPETYFAMGRGIPQDEAAAISIGLEAILYGKYS